MESDTASRRMESEVIPVGWALQELYLMSNSKAQMRQEMVLCKPQHSTKGGQKDKAVRVNAVQSLQAGCKILEFKRGL